MSDPFDLATKGEAVEEWFDLHFFRPIGARIARRAYPTRISADQLTAVSLVIGLAAGHLFVYTSPALNALGFTLFIVSDIFDSADGQLARMRNASTGLGRILDGVSDSTRFANLYLHLCIRLVVAGWSWPGALALAVAAGFSHSTQSAAVDCIRHAFLAIGVGRGSELGDAGPAPTTATQTWRQRFALASYRAYSRRQQWLFPRTWELAATARAGMLPAVAGGIYRRQASRLLPLCAWLGQNIRFLLVGIAGISGAPAAMLWVTLIPMNILMLGLIVAQERIAGRVAASARPAASPPKPVSVA